MRRAPATRPRRAPGSSWVGAVVLAGLAVLAVVLAAEPVHAVEFTAQAQPPATLNEVIDRLRAYVVTLLAGLATLFATVGGVRYLMAGSDPAEVAKAKSALKFAAVGYGVAVLAPLLVNILKGIVGGP
ncbi:MAG: pilin [Sporichthyaceae bacterium]|nr:pilin [Sporichthyaceae bacterium]